MKVYAKKRSDRKKKWSVVQENEVTGQVKTVANFQFKKECDDFIANYHGELETNRYVNTNMSLAEFVEDSTDWFISSYKTEQSANNKLATLKNIVLPTLGHKPLAEITVKDWEQLFTDMNTSKRLFLKDNHVDKKSIKKKVTRSTKAKAPDLKEFSDYLKSEICLDTRKHRRKCPFTCYESGFKSCRCPKEVLERVKYKVNSKGQYILCNQITAFEFSELTGLTEATIKHWCYAISFPSADNWQKIYPHLKYKKYPIDVFSLMETEVEIDATVGREIKDEPYKYQTIKNTRRIIRRLYTRAKQLDLVKHPTIAIAQLPHKLSAFHTPKVETWTMDQTDLFLNYLKDEKTSLHKGMGIYGKDRDYFAYYLFAKKGLRKSELPAIRIDRDIHFMDNSSIIQIRKQVDTSVTTKDKTEYKEITIKTAKSNEDYDVIGLNEMETNLLKDHLEMMTKEKASTTYKGTVDYLFAKEDGSLISHGYFYSKFKRIIRNDLSIQLPDIRLHDLRASLATNLSKEVPLLDLQKIMRHSSYKTTELYYIKPKDETILDVWNKVDENIKERKLV